VDYFGNPLNGAVITVETGSYGAYKVIKQQTADKNGWVSFVLFSEMYSANGSFPFGIVTVTGDFGGASASQQVSLAAVNKDVTLSFSLPSWSSYVLPVAILVGIVVLLTLIYYVRKRIHRNE
jgi:predicted aspartyl protease